MAEGKEEERKEKLTKTSCQIKQYVFNLEKCTPAFQANDLIPLFQLAHS